jgi:hypothetical protein
MGTKADCRRTGSPKIKRMLAAGRSGRYASTNLSDFVPVPKCQRHGVLNVSGAWQKLLVGLEP